MTATRIEELEDYAELDGLIDPELVPAPPPLSRCFVHRSESGAIDGYCFIQTVAVVEPIWVAENVRGRGVAPQLFNEAVTALSADGTARNFVCHALTPEVEGYLKRLGMRDVGRTFVMEVPRGSNR